MNQKNRESVIQKFEFRNIRPEETDQAVMIEQICFPPDEACSEAHMRERIEKAPELFLVAEEKESGKIAGFLNGMRERKNDREVLILTCLQAKVEMYKGMGFCDRGIANSSWGGEQWHEMSCMTGE